MDTSTYFNLTPAAETSFSFAEETAVLSQFEAAFNQCTNAWRDGNNEAVLQDNLQVRFGGMLLQYFQRKLVEEVGAPVALTFSDSNFGPQTLVHMPQPEELLALRQAQSETVAQTETSEQTTTKTGEPGVGAKKAPRPMNCWILFRARMYKKLKTEQPVLSVQQISARCSRVWKGLPKAQKDLWRAAANSAKEEHLRQHPDYKYSPRKPGEKKKRQSRKAKHAASGVVGAYQSNFASGRDMVMLAPGTTYPSTTVAAVIDNTFAGPAAFLGLGSGSLDHVYDTEPLRHGRLEAEFGAELDANPSVGLSGDAHNKTPNLRPSATVQPDQSPTTKNIFSTSMSISPQAVAMAIARDPKSLYAQNLFSGRSGADIVRLMRSLRDPAEQAALTVALLARSSAVPNPSVELSEKTKKALNAYLGFRCFYILCPLLKAFPMKKLSFIIGQMWEVEPNKSMWLLITKAWSIIRDQIGKARAPLDEFLRLVCPHLNITSPETYLEVLGWEVSIDEEGAPKLSRDRDTRSSSTIVGLVNTTVSVEEIIAYSLYMGYAQGYIPELNTSTPTFLGRSFDHEKNTPSNGSRQAGAAVQDYRVAARNKRRTKRQSAQEAGAISALQQEIIHAHATGLRMAPQANDETTSAVVPGQFYDQMASLLTRRVVAHGLGIVGPSNYVSPQLTENDFASVPAINWEGFRLGANGDATLPPFDPTGL